jgi:hypothetical protein
MEHRACQPETPTTTARVYYFPEFAAGGGPPPSGPVRSPHTFMEDTAAGVALVYLADENLWAVMSSNGDTYAEAQDPGELTDWLSEYVATLGEMYAAGEL